MRYTHEPVDPRRRRRPRRPPEHAFEAEAEPGEELPSEGDRGGGGGGNPTDLGGTGGGGYLFTGDVHTEVPRIRRVTDPPIASPSYWRFDANFNDHLANRHLSPNDVTVSNGQVKLGANSALFGASGQGSLSVSHGDFTLPLNAKFLIRLWFRLTTNPHGSYLFGKYTQASTDPPPSNRFHCQTVDIGGNRSLYYTVDTPSQAAVTVVLDNAWSYNTWHRAVAFIDNQTGQIGVCVDNNPYTTAAIVPQAFTNTAPLVIGNLLVNPGLNTQSVLNGNIDDVGVRFSLWTQQQKDDDWNGGAGTQAWS